MNEKTYYNVIQLSSDFHGWMDTGDRAEHVPTAAELLLWQARFQLAIAQQLSMVAKHLGTIVKTAEEKKS
jgi:hypothetical protein